MHSASQSPVYVNCSRTAIICLKSLALLRYQILVPLHYTNEQVKEIVPLVSLFRSHCLKSSLQTIQHQQIIADKMEQLSRASEEIEVEGYRLIDQVRFTFNDN